MKKVMVILTLLLLMTVIPAYAGDQYDYKSAEFKEVASQFMCMCGCGQDHFECNMQGCGLNDSFKSEIKEMMDDGLTKDQIKDYYLSMYGEEILTAPEKKGFSLTAWVLPFVALGVAGIGIVFIIRKWVAGYKEEETSFEARSEEEELEDEIVKSMIDEERKKYF
ncbi:cytochrome c-type biogenesis protein [Anaerobacillus alkaliphilus]|nr:cytochrome c-type biogenesis protein [Anaerobacillus alkaliphilus]